MKQRKKVISRVFKAMRFMADMFGYAHMRTFKNVRIITKAEFASYHNTIRVKQ
jgi:transposase-like protein